MANCRLNEIQRHLSETGIEAFLVSDLLNVRYLSGYTGSSARLLITPDDAFIITDSRYEMQAAIECADFTLVLIDGQWEATAVTLIRDINPETAVFEGNALNYLEWHSITSALPDTKLLPADNFVAQLRLIKSAD